MRRTLRIGDAFVRFSALLAAVSARSASYLFRWAFLRTWKMVVAITARMITTIIDVSKVAGEGRASRTDWLLL